MDSGPRPDSSLVTTAWVAEHLTDPHVVLVEASPDAALYPRGHIAGAVNWSGQTAIAVPLQRPRRFRAGMERLLADSGIDNYTTVVLYGSSANLAAARALWCLVLCGHPDVRLLDGGREQWLREQRPLSTTPTRRVPATYKAAATSGTYRAVPRDVRHNTRDRVVIDAGTRANAGQRAVHIPWSSTVNDRGAFRPAAELESLFAAHGVTRAHHIVTSSLDGAASAHVWFALSRVLGFPHVRNCEGA